MRCLLREAGRAAARHDVDGWRQWRHLTRVVKALFNRERSTRRAKAHPDRIEAYLERCRDLACNGADPWVLLKIEHYLAHAGRQIDQVDRRLLKGETIPHSGKVFSIFEPHTRWVSKGKAGCPVELGVPLCVLEDNHGFILHHEIMWRGSDVDDAVPMIEAAQARFPDLRLCSFDRGFHSPANRVRLDELLEHNVLPRKGRLSKADREREGDEEFVAMRRGLHPRGGALDRGLQHPPHRPAAAQACPATTPRRLTALPRQSSLQGPAGKAGTGRLVRTPASAADCVRNTLNRPPDPRFTPECG